jgi:hypothetical protein
MNRLLRRFALVAVVAWTACATPPTRAAAAPPPAARAFPTQRMGTTPARPQPMPRQSLIQVPHTLAPMVVHSSRFVLTPQGVMHVPEFPVNPFVGMGLTQASVFGYNRAMSPYSAYASNPYAPMYAMSAYAMPMSAYPMAGYGGGSSYSNPYAPASTAAYRGDDDGASSTYAGSYASAKQRQSLATVPMNALDLLAVPSENGKLTWPLGLRILAPAPQAQQLRQQVEGLVRSLGFQAASGQVQSNTIEAAIQATRDLRSLLHKREGSAAIAEHTYRDAERFLQQLEVGIHAAAH